MSFKNDKGLIWESYVDDLGGKSGGFEDAEMAVIEVDDQPAQDLEIEEVPDEPKGETSEVVMGELSKLEEYVGRLAEKGREGCEFEDWMIAKIVMASDYVSDISHRLDAKVDFANNGIDQVDAEEVVTDAENTIEF